MEDNLLKAYDEYIADNFNQEILNYFYMNGCWNPSCNGDCDDLICMKKFVKVFDKIGNKNKVTIKDML